MSGARTDLEFPEERLQPGSLSFHHNLDCAIHEIPDGAREPEQPGMMRHKPAVAHSLDQSCNDNAGPRFHDRWDRMCRDQNTMA